MADKKVCDECTEHSGVVERLNAGDKIMERFEKFMNYQNKRSDHIFISVILILLTSLSSIFLAFYLDQKKSISLNKPKHIEQKAEIAKIYKEKKCLIEDIQTNR